MSSELKGPSSDDDETDFIGFSPVKQQQEPVAEETMSQHDIDQANAMAKQLHVFKPGITFVPDAKLEVLDARDNKWYQCRVVEVDWGELDILVHYDRWSVRFDEWLKMDSTRIKPLPQKEIMKNVFKIGEKVLGFWALDGKYYLGQVTKHTSEDYYEVCFYDGYSKGLRTSQLKKVKNPKQYMDMDINHSPKNLKQFKSGANSLPSPPVFSTTKPSTSAAVKQRRLSSLTANSSPVSPSTTATADKSTGDSVTSEEDSNSKRNSIFNVEILEAKRKTKRKPDVEELFKSIKRKRKIEEVDETDDDHFKSVPPKQKIKREIVPQKSDLVKPQRPDSPATTAVSESMPSKDCHYFEVDIGSGWKEVCSRRTHGIWSGKWDVFFLTPDNKKLRTRQELLKYDENHPLPMKISDISFSVRSAKQKYDAQNPKKLDIFISESMSSDDESKSSKSRAPSDFEEEFDQKDDDYYVDSSDDEASDEDEVDENQRSKKMTKSPNKSMRITSSESEETDSSPIKQDSRDVSSVKLSSLLMLNEPQKKESIQSTPRSSDITPIEEKIIPLPRPKVPRKVPEEEMEIKADLSHKCRHKSCEKSFRKESLLQMHMKHYHPELLKRGSVPAPNVADLAYARTVGDHLDVSSSLSPSIPFTPPDFTVPERRSESARRRKLSEVRRSFEKKTQEKVPKSARRELVKTPVEESESDDGSVNVDFANESKDGDNSINVLKGKLAHKGIERSVTRQESSRLKNRKSESMSEDDPGEKKPGYLRRSKRKVTEELKISIPSPSDGLCEALDRSEELNTDNWNEAQSDYEDAIIHCGCKSQEEDGLMLQCDICLTWQHGSCYDIEDENQVPEKYICLLCENPKGQRSSMRFRHHQDWLKEGKLPRFSFSSSKPDLRRLESCIRRGHDLSANVLQLTQLIYSLRLKLKISKEADHPKFVMWHKKWEDTADEDSVVKTEAVSPDNKFAQIQDFIAPFQPPNTPLQGMNDAVKTDLSTFDTQFSNTIQTPIAVSGLGNTQPMSLPEALSSVNRELEKKDISSYVNDPIDVKTDLSSLPSTLLEIQGSSSVLAPLTGVSHLTECDLSKLEISEDHLKIATSESSLIDDKKMKTGELASEARPCSLLSDEGISENNLPLKELRCETRTESNLKDSVEHKKENEGNNNTLQCEEDKMKVESELKSQIVDLNEGLTPPSSDLTQETPKYEGMEKEIKMDDNEDKNNKNLEQKNSQDKGSDERLNEENVKDICEEEDDQKSIECINSKEEESHEKETNEDDNINSMQGNEQKLLLKESITELKKDEEGVDSLNKYDSEFKMKGQDSDENKEREDDNKKYDVKESFDTTDKYIIDQEVKEMINNETERQDKSKEKSDIGSIEKESLEIEEDCMEDVETLTKYDDKNKEEEEIGEKSVEPMKGIVEGNSQDSLEDNEDFDLALGDLGSGGETGINDGLVDLLSSHPVLDQLVDVEHSDLAPLVQNPVPLTPAPIIPKNERIEPVKCKLNLLEHIEEIQNKVFKRFDTIEAQIKELEDEMGITSEVSLAEEELLCSSDNTERDATTLQTRALVNLLLNDINTVKKMAEFTDS